MPHSPLDPLTINGRFFHAGDQRVFLKTVTYGPFPTWWKESHADQLHQIRTTGFTAIRVYDRPTPELLDAAEANGLYIWMTLPWGWGTNFFTAGHHLAEARVRLTEFLRESGDHSALAGVLVANEIPSDMVRWMGPTRVREALESLIADCREVRPKLLYGYGNFPTTEYLEPVNADFSAFNIYLENQADFSDYLFRLQAIAGDRPVFITEMGLDSRTQGEMAQADLLQWQVETALRTGTAGTTVYSWCDAWQNGVREMKDWDFGLKARDGRAKEALTRASRILPSISSPSPLTSRDQRPRVSVVICTHNGAERLATCLQSLEKLNYHNYEIIVVNDGSADTTSEVVEAFPSIQLINQDHLGLSAARNRGAEEATGDIIAYTDDDCEADPDWLLWLVTAYEDPAVVAAGGPNLPPPAAGLQEALVAAAEGAPSHILLTDTAAEHIPGCNLSIRREVLRDMGGFNPIFRAAGDDVDLCWRLLERGGMIRFIPSAFVWHRRRVSLWRYIQQQRGYGKAEKVLKTLHPHRFNSHGEPRWDGVVYTGGTAHASDHSVIYHGPCGTAPYQSVNLRMMPRRPIEKRFQSPLATLLLHISEFSARALRSLARSGFHPLRTLRSPRRRTYHEELRRASSISKHGQTSPRGMTKVYSDDLRQSSEWRVWTTEGEGREKAISDLLVLGWREIENDTHWDLTKDEVKVLFATEQTDKPGRLTHVRIQHGARASATVEQLKSTLSRLK